VFGIPFIQGYGATEVAGAAAVQLQDNVKPGRVGPPLSCNGELGVFVFLRLTLMLEIKLVDLPEKNYTSQDKPFPRGEIWIRGPNVAAGYFKSEEQTYEATSSVNYDPPNGFLAAKHLYRGGSEPAILRSGIRMVRSVSSIARRI
jgi:long-subunit acyl-CoA synthetase (AMP-forming)